MPRITHTGGPQQADRQMAQEVDPSSYKDVILVLAAAGVVIPVFRKLGVSSILGFLLVGILIGPSALGRLTDEWPWLSLLTPSDPEGIAGLAELGVVFLLFMIGI